jgi:glycosyltransferase involved in cell wall biosynthesis
MDCDRWRTGCGRCPYLLKLTPFPRDATASNWRRKREIYARCRFHVVTASHWLMRKVEQSMLTRGMVSGRVIPTGVDTSLFRPGRVAAARQALGIAADAWVFLFVAKGLRFNWAKDFPTVRAAVAQVARRFPGQRIVLLGRGEAAPTEREGALEVRSIPFSEDLLSVVDYYRAADVLLHAAHQDTFPNVILEALACGTPVVATGVCGIVEQVKSVGPADPAGGWARYGAEEATGFLVPPRDPQAMAAAIEGLMCDDALRRRLSANAAQDARARFGSDRFIQDHLELYQEVRERHRPREPGEAKRA